MQCKILSKGGQQFVCLPDGTRLPLQTVTIVIQQGQENAHVTCTVLVDERIPGVKCEWNSEKGRVFFKGESVPCQITADFHPRENEDSNNRATFTLLARIGDSIQEPINSRTYANTTI